MAHDDMNVVMYKILAYLYWSLRRGEEPNPRHYAHDGDVLHIPYPYWERVMAELARHGYVEGVTVMEDMSGETVVCDARPVITFEGVEFLQENSAMRRALKFLQETRSALPFI